MSNLIQTFFADPNAVNGAEFIALTSVDLFFRVKPNSLSTSSGIVNPGVNVRICEVVNDFPRVDKMFDPIGRVEYANIVPSNDSQSSTTFSFSNPVIVETGRFYGIVVEFDDPGYEVWTHVAGDRGVGTNVSSVNITDNRNGKFYQYSSTTPALTVDTALKFGLDVAKFDTTAPVELTLTNHGYEFISFINNVGSIVAGETVRFVGSNQTGTLATTKGSIDVVGTGTSFTSLAEETYITITDGSDTFTGRIEYVNDDGSLSLFEQAPFTLSGATFAIATLGDAYRVDYRNNKLILANSNASTAQKFAVGQTLTGEQSGGTVEIASLDHFEIDRVRSALDVNVSGDNTYSPRLKTVKYDGSSYVDDDVEQPLPNNTEVLTDETSVLASKSIEVTDTNIFDEGSVAVLVEADTTNPFAAPMIDLNNSSLMLTSETIDDQYLATYANSTVYDSEVFNGGVAINKHITNKLELSEGRVAEDLKVYLTAYRPRSTDVRVYAKFRGPADQEPFDDKLWTPLEESGEFAGTYSSSVEREDLIELEFSVPSQPDSIETLGGSFATSEDSNLISSSDGFDPSSVLAPGDFVKVYNELFPDNFMVTTVESVNTTTVTVAEDVTLSGILGAGQKIDKLFYGRTGFTYQANDDAIRYLDESGGVHDGFVEAQLKIVFLGDPQVRISPRVVQLEMIGVSS